MAASVAVARMDNGISTIVEGAAAAFESWSNLGPNARRKLLNQAADVIESRADQFVELMAEELRASEPWARFNVMLGAGMVREAAALTTQITGEVIPSDKPGLLSMALREPVGVVLGIAPWNAPVILGCRAIATPLACGNTVILKASERCPRTQGLIVEAFREAAFPDGVVNLVTNEPADAVGVVRAMIEHLAVRRINFTGSTEVGRSVAKLAAEQLKPVLLELGGKAPLIVLEDADLDEAVKAAAFGAFLNAGQICMSTERIIVVGAVADEFARRFAKKVSSMPAAAVGSQVDEKAEADVRALIDDAIAKGAHQLAGAATVVGGVTPEMRLYRDESFGPVVGIIRVADEEEAVRVANDTAHGLAASVFTGDIARGLRVARRIQSGICHINGPTVHDEPQMPFGGVGASGYGRFGGKAGIDFFTELRWITIAGEPGHYPI
jgi:acyl-CoA reductase-like NAD-dependent aldehyde dehydrogenase